MSVTYVDPVDITKFNCTDAELEARILFWICAAGKNALTSARSLDNLLKYLLRVYATPASDTFVTTKEEELLTSPFALIRRIGLEDLPDLLKFHGIGCYNNKGRTFWHLAHSGLNLKTCSVEDLESIKGIGMKTSRCFLIHSRVNAEVAGLDVHIKSFLTDLGIKVPKSVSKSKYLELEVLFVKLAKKLNKSVADLDLMVWKNYSGRDDKSDETLSFLRSIKIEELL